MLRLKGKPDGEGEAAGRRSCGPRGALPTRAGPPLTAQDTGPFRPPRGSPCPFPVAKPPAAFT